MAANNPWFMHGVFTRAQLMGSSSYQRLTWLFTLNSTLYTVTYLYEERFIQTVPSHWV